MGWGGDLWGGSNWDSATIAEGTSPLDVVFDCRAYATWLDVLDPGVLTVVSGISSDGTQSVAIITNTTLTSVSGISGVYLTPVLITSGTTLTTATAISAEPWILSDPKSWVWAGRIGSMDFVMDDGGEASRRPMSYSGIIHKIKKLGSSVIVYGDNGVSRMTPHGVMWALKDLHMGGTKGRNAMCGDENKHFFIDKIGLLYRILPEALPERIDYSNTLSAFGSDVVMSYDKRLDIAYMADDSIGYALTANGLGQCPPTITGVGYNDGTFYITSTVAIVNSPLNCTTDILDFGTRTEKTIMYLDTGVYATEDVYVAIDYRWSKDDAWTTSDWRRVDDYGRVSFNITSTEFRIKFKLTTYEDIRIDYVNIYGKFIGNKPIEGVAHDN